ncbi:MAG: Co2+/Mg2+ efflux protein ApaG [Shewanella sp.]|nr:Co2+/Mg2+ efflux protein ApaG [Shewanella sp.]MCF1430728.1 Co2+/Mg2+ efflux protein ApaG [Shewanella sp.]MCF1438971.1 Co2+/Mg2+ efflux protein ApaG [Shewanella sp.]MCF1458509.1 Co2+/Mg2+ efflux protein ApaG [Shewanella sp.]
MTALEASIRIEVQAQYVEQQSDPDQDKFLFSYTITITNEGTSPAVLESRHWIITDANGHKNEVQGNGVVGETPTIAPNASYQYTSGTVLETPVGVMQGSYQMQSADGQIFKAHIPTFRLAVPGLLH